MTFTNILLFLILLFVIAIADKLHTINENIVEGKQDDADHRNKLERRGYYDG